MILMKIPDKVGGPTLCSSKREQLTSSEIQNLKISKADKVS